jgi:hypothetical protein
MDEDRTSCVLKLRFLHMEFFHVLQPTEQSKFKVEVFWVVTPYSVVVGYQRFRGPCCLDLHALQLTERNKFEVHSTEFFSGFPIKILYAVFVFHMLATCSTHLILLVSSPK